MKIVQNKRDGGCRRWGSTIKKFDSKSWPHWESKMWLKTLKKVKKMEWYKVIPGRRKERILYMRCLLNSNEVSFLKAYSLRKSRRKGEATSYSTFWNVTWTLAFTEYKRKDHGRINGLKFWKNEVLINSD